MPDWLDTRFPKSLRLLNKKQFDRVFFRSRKVSSNYFTVLLHYRQGEDLTRKPRLGLIVSKKVDKRAVVRNRIKRLVRESFRRQQDLAACDVVVIARPLASKTDNRALLSSLDTLWCQAAEKITQNRRKT